MFFSRRVKDDVTTAELNKLSIRGPNTPDLMVLGSNIMLTPSVPKSPAGVESTRFYPDEMNIPLLAEDVGGISGALGLVILLDVLSWIELAPIDWSRTLNEAYMSVLLSMKNT